MSLLKRYSLEWKEDPASRDEPPEVRHLGREVPVVPFSLLSLLLSLPFFLLATLHTVSGDLRLNFQKKKSIYYRPFRLIYHWIICLHSQNPTKWFSLVMWFTCILKLHATPSRSQRHKCVLSFTEHAQLKQIKSRMHIPLLGLCKM